MVNYALRLITLLGFGGSGLRQLHDQAGRQEQAWGDAGHLGIFLRGMKAGTDQSHRFQNGRPRVLRIIGIAGIGAEAHGDGFQVAPGLGIDVMSEPRQPVGAGILHQRRTALLDAELDLGIGDQGVPDQPLAIGQDTVVLGQVGMSYGGNWVMTR